MGRLQRAETVGGKLAWLALDAMLLLALAGCVVWTALMRIKGKRAE